MSCCGPWSKVCSKIAEMRWRIWVSWRHAPSLGRAAGSTGWRIPPRRNSAGPRQRRRDTAGPAFRERQKLRAVAFPDKAQQRDRAAGNMGERLVQSADVPVIRKRVEHTHSVPPGSRPAITRSAQAMRPSCRLPNIAAAAMHPTAEQLHRCMLKNSSGGACHAVGREMDGTGSEGSPVRI